MSELPRPPSSSSPQQYIEVPVGRGSKSSFNVGNLLLIGGLGYVMFRTFLMEERINDLTVLVKRQNASSSLPSSMRHVTPNRPLQRPNEQYDSSSDEDEDDVRVRQEEGGEESDDDDVRIEEQPRAPDPPPQERPESPPPPPSGSAFVTTRQRRAGSELHRNVRSSKE